MKKKSVNPAMAMMAARAMRTPAVRPTPMAAPQVAPNAISTPPGMPGMKKGGMSKKCMKEGGMADKAQDKAMIKKALKQHDEQEHKGGKGTKLALKKGGMMKKMAAGGKTLDKPSDYELIGYTRHGRSNLTGPQREVGPSNFRERGKGDWLTDAEESAKNRQKDDDNKRVGPNMKKGGMTKGCGYASGGKASQLAKANGIAVRGKSKGKIC